jgi:ferric-dicitrate binding protein FerR (iron transport regulator)
MDKIKILVEKYLTGQLSPDEAAKLNNWLSENDANKSHFAELKQQWSPYAYKDSELEEVLQKAKQKVFEKKTRPNYFIKIAGYAAVALIALLINFLLKPKETAAPNEKMYSAITQYGEKKVVKLPDGSTVHMNAGSRIDYNANFKEKRYVKLTGEAFFEVATNKNLCFEVETKDYDVVVHGTRFNVSAYHNEHVQTSLIEGSISIRHQNKIKKIVPGETVRLKGQELFIERATNVKTTFAWTQNRIVFNALPFDQLIQKLERWYNVKITVDDDDLNAIIYSGTFKNNETLSQILDVLSLSENLNYKQISKDNYIIRKNK